MSVKLYYHYILHPMRTRMVTTTCSQIYEQPSFRPLVQMADIPNTAPPTAVCDDVGWVVTDVQQLFAMVQQLRQDLQHGKA